eukprot:g6442.t1
MTFVCLSPSRFISDVESEFIASEESKEEVQRALNELDFGGVDKLVLSLPGGGIAARGHGRCPEMAVSGCFIAVLSGALQNYAYLVRKYCLEELSLPTTISLEAIRDLTPVREAALLCKLYERLGTGMLTKLRGKFAFCLFDSSTMKVLAARDSSGTVPLVTGETEDGFLFVASGEILPQGARNLIHIEPGQYIYGWQTPSLKYANPLDVVERSAAEAVDAASAALKGIKIQDVTDKERRRNSRGGVGGGSTTDHLDQRRRAVSSEPYRRNQNIYIYNQGTPDVQSWRQPFDPCHNPAFNGTCYQGGRCHPESIYRLPGDTYGGGVGGYRESRHLMESGGPGGHPRIRRPSLEPNWRPNGGENHYRRGISPEASRPVYGVGHPHHDVYTGQPMVAFMAPEAAPKSGFKMKKGSRRREDGVQIGVPTSRH